MSTILAIVGDLHVISTVALCPPAGILLDDGGVYYPSKAQKWLWSNWLDYWQQVKQARDATKARLVVIFNGDMMDGDHHGTTQIVTGNVAVELEAVLQVIYPALSLEPDEIYVIRGTSVHVGKSGQWEETIARQIGAVPDSDRESDSWWHLRRVFDGVRCDIAHHGRMGTRPWTKSNAAQMMAAEITYNYAARGWQMPHLAIRSHRHKAADSYDNHPVRVVQTPAWQLHTEYTHAVVANDLADIGGLIVTCSDGQVWVKKVTYAPYESDPWT